MLPYDDDFDDADDLHQPVNWTRISVIIFAAIMIVALLGGAILQAWSAVPAILGYWRSDYRLAFTEVSAGACNQGNVSAGSLLCVCGVIDAGDGDADVDIQVRHNEGNLMGNFSLRDQPSGIFCQDMRLQAPLVPGEYFLTATPRLSRDTIARWFFTIRDNRRDV